MKNFKVYTCGKMNGFTFGQQMIWRKELTYYIEHKCEGLYGTHSFVTVINPPNYFNFEDKHEKSEREIMDWELGQVCDSDILVFNFDGISDSIGSHMEIGAAIGASIASGKNIKIVAIGDIPQNVHPWINLCYLRHEKTVQDAAEYIVKYLLV